jgi:hypothetical protein
VIDLEERVRETLHRRAMDVQPKLEVPSGLIPRAGRRIARNFSGALVAVALVAVGAVTGFRALTGPDPQLPVDTPAQAACRASDLIGSSDLMTPEGMLNVREGRLVVTNEGSAACSLVNTPSVRVLADGETLDFTGALDPLWKSPPPGWPVVTLQPGEKAMVRVRWTQWCSMNVPTTWEIHFPGNRGTLSIPLDYRQEVPGCEGSDPSTLELGPFEPFSK